MGVSISYNFNIRIFETTKKRAYFGGQLSFDLRIVMRIFITLQNIITCYNKKINSN